MLTLFALTLPLLVMVAAVFDMTQYKIPNWLNLVIAGAFLPVAAYSGLSLGEIGMHYAAGVVLLIVGFAIFALGVFGGGDAKLLAACGVWFGFAHSGQFITAAAICGGVISIVMIFWTIAKYAAELDFGNFLPSFRKASPQIPYALALAAGTIIAFPNTGWLSNLAQSL